MFGIVLVRFCPYWALPRPFSFVDGRKSHSKQAVREAATICPAPYKLTYDLLLLKVVSESRGDVAYLCANFSLPRPVCSRIRPDVRDRQTGVRHASSLNASTLWGGGITIHVAVCFS